MQKGMTLKKQATDYSRIARNGKTFDRLMPLIVSEQNIILAYRNICKNSGSKTPGTDGKTIAAIQLLPIESVIKTVRNKLNY